MVFYNLGHIKGEKGEKGDKGDKGNKGDKGDAGTITLDNNVTQGSSNAVKSSGIYTALTGKVNTSDIVDNLTTDDATKVLSAKQGKLLNDLIGTAITYINQWGGLNGR